MSQLNVGDRVDYVDYYVGHLTLLGQGRIESITGTTAVVRFDADDDFHDVETVETVDLDRLEKSTD